MTWTAPRTWAVGDLVTASMMNANIRDNLAVVRVPLVVTLPASPADEQKCCLVDSLAAPTYAWMLQYVAASTLGRGWIYLGGWPAYIAVGGSETLSSVSNAWSAFPTDTRFTLPRDGTYRMRFGGTPGGNASAATGQIGVSFQGGTVPIGQPALSISANNTTVGALSSVVRNNNLAGGGTLGIWGNDSDSTRRIAWSARWLEVTPEAIS